MDSEAPLDSQPLSDEEFEAQLLTFPIKYNERGEATLHGLTYEEVCALQEEPTAEDIARANAAVAEYLAARK